MGNDQGPPSSQNQTQSLTHNKVIDPTGNVQPEELVSTIPAAVSATVALPRSNTSLAFTAPDTQVENPDDSKSAKVSIILSYIVLGSMGLMMVGKFLSGDNTGLLESGTPFENVMFGIQAIGTVAALVLYPANVVACLVHRGFVRSRQRSASPKASKLLAAPFILFVIAILIARII